MRHCRTVHQIWFQGADRAPERYAAKRYSWHHHHPRWRHRVWDARTIGRLIDKHYPQYRTWYHTALPLMIQQIDVAKVFIMHRYGGVYADMDSQALRPLDPLLAFPGVTVSFVNTQLPEHVGIALVRGMSCCPMINNGVLISPERRHPFWLYYLARLQQEVQPRSCVDRVLGDGFYVMNTTGPLLWTQCINEWRNAHPGHVRVLHYSYLEPILGMDTPDRQVVFPWSFVAHQHASSWCQRDIGWIRFYYRYVRPRWCFWLVCLLLLFFLAWTVPQQSSVLQHNAVP